MLKQNGVGNEIEMNKLHILATYCMQRDAQYNFIFLLTLIFIFPPSISYIYKKVTDASSVTWMKPDRERHHMGGNS